MNVGDEKATIKAKNIFKKHKWRLFIFHWGIKVKFLKIFLSTLESGVKYLKSGKEEWNEH
jgi:hypothetical protein